MVGVDVSRGVAVGRGVGFGLGLGVGFSVGVGVDLDVGLLEVGLVIDVDDGLAPGLEDGAVDPCVGNGA